jgi:hypothetical protein
VPGKYAVYWGHMVNTNGIRSSKCTAVQTDWLEKVLIDEELDGIVDTTADKDSRVHDLG